MKYCPGCGTQILNDAQKFCETCGCDMTVIMPSQIDPQYSPSAPSCNAAPAPLPMKWFKFLIYFALFFSAVINAGMAIAYLTGYIYTAVSDVPAADVYEVFGGLWYADVAMGVGLLILAGLAIYARFALAEYKTSGPKLLYTLYIADTVLSVAYQVAAQWIMAASPYVELADLAASFSDTVSSVVYSPISCFVVVILNYAYFKKRKHLFVN